ncbi:type IX secretion system membrane protein PorP/SprF [Carboxylicivirga sp. M1479]|uniref:PorP/SprF family type IX secretion system membrane protein n=1 Tax=Carboxylicivirga sp. M1479 TaxID=2594476 RepID=UPI001177DEEF|nr:type IX secretion system membrane protein PorP/SprF [Carboxylicivirga sp. M1479]TRX70925.1 type IX secretion system membrane protein PorP/SprF [Carboxylicivirga sp. M1479]
MNRLYKNTLVVLSALLLFVGVQKVQAQQEPLYTQYMFNTVSVNPAYAGTRNAMNVLLLSRMQWTGMEGAPRTYDFTMHTPLNNYKMGLGLSVVSDSHGPVNNYYINVNYAYRVSLSESLTLSMGVKGGIYNYYVNLTNLNVGDEDVAFMDNVEQRFQPNAGLGLYLYADKYYFGASVPKLIQTTLNGEQSTTGSLSDLKQHVFLMGGYVFDINEDVKLKPSVLTKIVNGAPPSTDITAQCLYKDTYWLGATYRIGDAVALIGNIRLNKQLMIGYSYDFTVSELNNYNNGSHEIIISYDFDGFLKNKVKSPRYF